MSLEQDKNQIIAGIYNAKEFLFFFIGLATLIAIPFLGADAAGTWQLAILGAALTLEGFSSVIEISFNFMAEKGLPWYEDFKRKQKLKKKGI
jgi:hypothetical protein